MKKIILFCLMLIAVIPGLLQAGNHIQSIAVDSTDSYTLTTKAADTTIIFEKFIGPYYPTQICPLVSMPTDAADSIIVVRYYWGFFGSDWNPLLRVDTLVTNGTRDYLNKCTGLSTYFPQVWIPIDSFAPWFQARAIITADNGGDTAASCKYHTELLMQNAVPNHITPKAWCIYDTGVVPVSYALAQGAHDTTTLFTYNVGEKGATKFSVATYLFSDTTQIDSLLRIYYEYSHSGLDGSWTAMAAQDTLFARGVDANYYGYVTATAADNFWIPYDTLAWKFRARAILQADSTGGDTGTYAIKYCLVGIDERCEPPYQEWDYNFDRSYNISYALSAGGRDSTTVFIINLAKENLMAISPEVFLSSLGDADSLVMVRYWRSVDSLTWKAMGAIDTILKKSEDTLRVSRTGPTWLKADSTGKYFKAEVIIEAPGSVGDSAYFNIRAIVKGISEVCKQF